jgi:hypothetical protein
MPPPKKIGWAEKLIKSQYILLAILIHIVIFFLLGTRVIFPGFVPQGEFTGTQYVTGDEGRPNPPGPPPSKAESQEQHPVDISTGPATSMGEVIGVGTPSDTYNIPSPSILTPTPSSGPSTSGTGPSLNPSKSSFATRAPGIRNFIAPWGPNGSRNGPKGNGRDTRAEFVCYVASYAEGDWQATIETDKKSGQISRGSIPNLLRMVTMFTKNNIKANIVPEPLKLSSQEIFDKKPPFIFFNGHKNFVLTSQEVENLRKYLIEGGAIWGDNALAGKGSRFDIAFRREMKRVIPDDDKKFEVLPTSHPLFSAFFNIRDIPSGMNFYKEPIEAIKIDGEIAVLYTLNDYGDMMRMAFKEGSLSEPDLRHAQDKANVTPKDMWDDRDTYYRNFNPDSCKATFELGLNIVVHLLTRFQERLSLNP